VAGLSGFLFLSDTITPTDGARDVLAPFWTHPAAQDIALVAIGLDQSSSGGVFRTDGPNVLSGLGQPFPGGGGYIYLSSLNDIRAFRVQAAAAGTVNLRATAYRVS